MAASPHIAITPDVLAHVGPVPITNSMILSWAVFAFVVLLGLALRVSIKKTGTPGALQQCGELFVASGEKICASVTRSEEKAKKFFPLIATIFIFVLLNNWAGLLPGVGSIYVKDDHAAHETSEYETVATEAASSEIHGGGYEDSSYEKDAHHSPAPLFRAGSADLSFTLMLALVAVISAQIFGIRANGLWGYFKRFFNFKNPVLFFVGLLELVSEASKVVSFSFRLFGNIFAGEVLLMVMLSLVPFFVPMPFYGLEIFVGLIQAVVFSVLTLVFLSLATEKAH